MEINYRSGTTEMVDAGAVTPERIEKAQRDPNMPFQADKGGDALCGRLDYANGHCDEFLCHEMEVCGHVAGAVQWWGEGPTQVLI